MQRRQRQAQRRRQRRWRWGLSGGFLLTALLLIGGYHRATVRPHHF